MINWVYLLIASLLEVCWTISLKNLSFSKLKTISFVDLQKDTGQTLLIVLPFVGYVIFGVGNIYFFSQAMKVIPASTAFAIWMAMTLVGIKLWEVFFLKESVQVSDYFYLVLIVIAIIGLKKNNP
jgi:quaternary ammonium compound-resistance protein SugE